MTNADVLRKGDKILARVDLRDVPAGTAGKVSMVVGLTWIRYWVRFENGVNMGSINRAKLATPDEWRRRNDEPAEVQAGAASSDGAGDGVGEAAVGVEVNGVMVPQKLLDRSKSAHERLGR